MLKRSLSLILAVILMLSLASCGKSKKKEGNTLSKSIVVDYNGTQETKHEVNYEIDGDRITAKMEENGYRSEIVWEYCADGDCPCRVSSPFIDLDSNGVNEALGVLGNELSNTTYVGSGGAERSTGNTYTYDYTKKEMTNTYTENGNSVKTEITSFEDHGYEVAFTVIDSDGSRGTTAANECEYDDAGRVTKITKADSEDTHKHWIEYSYDDDGNLIKAIRYEDDRKPLMEIGNEYDADGRIVKKTCKNYAGNTSPTVIKYEYAYKSGKLKTFSAFGNDGALRSRTTFYYK